MGKFIETRLTEIQHFLGEAVNALVKYFYSEKRLKSELAHLLCGESGLVAAVEQVGQSRDQYINLFMNLFLLWRNILKGE